MAEAQGKKHMAESAWQEARGRGSARRDRMAKAHGSKRMAVSAWLDAHGSRREWAMPRGAVPVARSEDAAQGETEEDAVRKNK
jgi:hypothetical protein